MATDLAFSLLAVNVGNSRLAIGHFPRNPSCEAAAAAAPLPIAGTPLAMPDEILHLQADCWDREVLAGWLSESAIQQPVWAIGSVNQPLADEFADWLLEQGFSPPWWVDWRSLELPLSVPTPQHVGVDRLLAALAAARLREAERAIVIVDLGTAITVDLLTAEGVYAGGAILPGIELGARALQQGTHALPFVRFEGEEPPSPVGQVTAAAIQAGLYWGTVGAVSELITQIARGLNQLPDVMLTGGAATTLAAQLEPTTENQRPWRRIQCLPHLVLSGIALAHLQSQQQT